MATDGRWPRRVGDARGVPFGTSAKLWTGTNVLDGLIEAIRELTEGRWSDDRGGQPTVLASSPWLSDRQIVDVLIPIESCVVVAKQSLDRPIEARRLVRDGHGVWKLGLRQLDTSAVPTGTTEPPPEAYGHEDDRPEHDVVLGPVRITGWARPQATAQKFPMLHAKLAVLGYQCLSVYSVPGYGEHERLDFRPVLAWMGSANLTWRSRISAEVGVLTGEPTQVRELCRYMLDVIRVSEPLTSEAGDAEPELVDAEVYEPTSDDLLYLREREAEHSDDDGL